MDIKLQNEVALDGEPSIVVRRRSQIKLNLATNPYIAVAIPCGDKHESTVLTCPKDQGGCGQRWRMAGRRVPNLVPIHMFLSYMNLQYPLNTTMTWMVDHGKLSAEARQIMTKKAIRMTSKYILYWDDDVMPPPMGLYTMLNFMEMNPGAGAISGVYVTKETPCEPLIFVDHGKGSGWSLPMGLEAEPQPIFGAGAGFLLARTEAIVDTIQKLTDVNDGKEVAIWMDERTLPISKSGPDGPPDRSIMWGHDVRFCKLLNEHGWGVFGDGRVLCGHLDVENNIIYTVPDDAPGLVDQRKKNINTKDYWDTIYGHEGANTWRQYPEMFSKVEAEIQPGDTVVEFGCGVGMLGSRITAFKPIIYTGYDISAQAVAFARARFLNAYQLDIKDMAVEDLADATVVVATEVIEHLDRPIFDRMMDCIHKSQASKFVFTVPDDCMGPDEVKEHQALFNEDLVREYVGSYLDTWKLRVEKADENHIICVMERE